MRAAYGKGYCDALTEDAPGSLCLEHGYRVLLAAKQRPAPSGKAWQDIGCAAGPRCSPRCGVLDRTDGTTLGAPCVLARNEHRTRDERRPAKVS